MITEKDTIKCEAVFNDERTHRFLWKQVWNKDKPIACVIMINPCQANTVVTDTTTFLVGMLDFNKHKKLLENYHRFLTKERRSHEKNTN